MSEFAPKPISPFDSSIASIDTPPGVEVMGNLDAVRGWRPHSAGSLKTNPRHLDFYTRIGATFVATNDREELLFAAEGTTGYLSLASRDYVEPRYDRENHTALDCMSYDHADRIEHILKNDHKFQSIPR